MRVRWSRPALTDLRSIRAYVAQDSPARADAVIGRLRAVTELLEQFPYAGRPGMSPATRELVVRRTPFIVVYRVTDEVQVLRVRHGAQDWPPP